MVQLVASFAPPVGSAPRRLPGLPQHVSSHASGGRDLWSPPLETPPPDPGAALDRVLTEVLDPELSISIMDLGLVYGTAISEGNARIELTFTATACPCMDFIKEDIRDRLLRESWIQKVHIEEVWDPPWTTDRITPAGRQALKKLGVGA